MPIRYEVDVERRVLVARADGTLCDQDLLEYGRCLREDPQVKAADHELVDLRGVDLGSNVSTEGVRSLARFWRAAYDEMKGGKLAIIAKDDATFGMARMYQSLRDDGPDRIQVFREEADAWSWLDSRSEG